MRTIHAGLMALVAAPLAAQANAVPGTDVTLYDLSVGVYGRRGPAYPNGEVGLGLGHSFCNSGTVDIPWQGFASGSVMLDSYPRIAFLLARESGGRMVQVSGKSFLKHSRVAYNFSTGPCAPCTSSGGPFMFQGCSDTYSTNYNGNRYNLGPTDEVDPWLGTWNPVGSYFDRGDPPVGGAAAIDGVQSLTTTQVSAFDDVKNRIEVRESALTSGGTFHGQVQMMIEGEPVQNRGNNLLSAPLAINWSGASWNASIAGPVAQGSVLTRWTGATWDMGGNGIHDGRFLVAVAVTPAGPGMWHYEYAVHNLDNARGGASLRVPVDPAATVVNAGFRDIDANGLNDWSFVRSASEVAFTAAAGNALDWNCIYNFWFDCSAAPSSGQVLIDQARPGAGALDLAVGSEVPGGPPLARLATVGTGCGECTSSFYEHFPTAAGFDLAGNGMSLTLAGGAYTVAQSAAPWTPPAGTALVLRDDDEAVVALPFPLPYPGGATNQLRVCSNGFVSPAGSNGTDYDPSVAALLTGQPRWALAWHDLNPAAGGQVLFDAGPTAAVLTWNDVPNFSGGGQNRFQARFLPGGTVHVLWQSMQLSGNDWLVGWSPGGGAGDPGNRDLSATLAVPLQLCAGSFGTLALGASARPVLGTSIQLATSDVPSGAGFAGTVLSLRQASPPQDLGPLGMPGCFAHTVGGTNHFVPAPPPAFQVPLAIPLSASFTGLTLTAQSYAWRPPLTPLGLVVSNGLLLTLGPQ